MEQKFGHPSFLLRVNWKDLCGGGSKYLMKWNLLGSHGLTWVTEKDIPQLQSATFCLAARVFNSEKVRPGEAIWWFWT